MKAADILNQWRPIAAVFGQRSSAWIVLLEICAAAENGLTSTELSYFNHCNPKWLRKMVAGGLLTTRQRPGKGHRPANVYLATPKAYELLRIQQP